jgi:hypothetical protein
VIKPTRRPSRTSRPGTSRSVGRPTPTPAQGRSRGSRRRAATRLRPLAATEDCARDGRGSGPSVDAERAAALAAERGPRQGHPGRTRSTVRPHPIPARRGSYRSGGQRHSVLSCLLRRHLERLRQADSRYDRVHWAPLAPGGAVRRQPERWRLGPLREPIAQSFPHRPPPRPGSTSRRRSPRTLPPTPPSADRQASIINLIRGSVRYASRKYWDELKPIYQAPGAEAAQAAQAALEDKWGQPCPGGGKVGRNAWGEFIPFLDYGACRFMARLMRPWWFRRGQVVRRL